MYASKLSLKITLACIGCGWAVRKENIGCYYSLHGLTSQNIQFNMLPIIL